MIAMIFEVSPKSEHRQDYLDTAAVLRPLLDGIEGFITRVKAPVKKPISAPNSVK